MKQNPLESAGAEFLVLAQLLIRRIQTDKAYANQIGYDLVCSNYETKNHARIQVKSRWATDANSFTFSNFKSDFIVLVRLNRGHSSSKKKDKKTPGEPDYFVFPTTIIKQMVTTSGSRRHKLSMKPKELSKFKDHQNKWKIIEEHLQNKSN